VQQVQEGQELERDTEPRTRPSGEDPERSYWIRDPLGIATGENLLGEPFPPGTEPEVQNDVVMGIKNAGQVAAMMTVISLTLALSSTLAGISLPPPTLREDVIGSPTRVLTLVISSWAAFSVGLMWIFAEGTDTFLRSHQGSVARNNFLIDTL
jgi:hypothetical protein